MKKQREGTEIVVGERSETTGDKSEDEAESREEKI